MEIVLESFLERAVARKQDRLRVLDGINRLDDLARGMMAADTERQAGLTDRIGEWFAEHRNWVQDPQLRTAERNRIGRILGEIKESMEAKGHATPASEKIGSEIERWQRAIPAPTPASKLRFWVGGDSITETFGTSMPRGQCQSPVMSGRLSSRICRRWPIPPREPSSGLCCRAYQVST